MTKPSHSQSNLERQCHLSGQMSAAQSVEHFGKACPSAAPQAVPSEQPIAEQPQSDKANLVVAVGKDLPPAPSVQSAFKRIRACGDEFTAYKMLLELLDRAACEAVAGSAGSDEKASAPESSLSVPKEQQ